MLGFYDPVSGDLTTANGTISVPFEDGFRGRLKLNRAHMNRIQAIGALGLNDGDSPAQE